MRLNTQLTGLVLAMLAQLYAHDTRAAWVPW